MAYNSFTWWLIGKRRFKRLLRRGPLSELKRYIDENYHKSDSYYINDTLNTILNRRYISTSDIDRFLKPDGTFSGSKALLVSPRMQEYLTSHGINWQNYFTPDELAKAEAFKKYFEDASKDDRALIGCIVGHLISNKEFELNDIFNDDNTLNPSFMDKFFRNSFFQISGTHSYFNYLKKNHFSYDFITKHFGKEMRDLIYELREGEYKRGSNIEDYSNVIADMIRSGDITRDNVYELLRFEKHNVIFSDKFFEVLDPFSNNARRFIDRDGNIDPRLESKLSKVEIALLKSRFDPYYLFKIDSLDVISKEQRIDFNQVYRLSPDGKLLFNEEYIRNNLDKFNLYYLFERMGTDSYSLDEVDYEKLGISREMLQSFIAMTKNSGNKQVEKILEKLLLDKQLLELKGEDAENFMNISQALLNHMNNSNSKELNRFFGDILVQLINNPENYEDKIARIEDVFIHNNLPEMAKRFLIYKIMYPEFDFEQVESLVMSPTLIHSTDRERDMIILGDLIRIAAESNNLSLRNYMNTIERGNAIYLLIATGEININELDPENRKTFTDFLNCLEAVYNQTPNGKANPVSLTGDAMADMERIHSLFGTTKRYDLPDRIVRMFGGVAGIESFRDLKEIMDDSVRKADARNRRYAVEGIRLEKGDFLKGIGDQDFLYDILQNGSVAKEFLGAKTPGSDSTPLDTDVTRIGSGLRVKTLIDESYSANWGPIWFVVKNDGRFKMTRENTGEDTQSRWYGKEVFVTHGEYGIRTGFGSCDIDYILVEPTISKDDREYMDEEEIEKRERVLDDTKFAIALNGFYIPVYDKNTGNLLFSPREYDQIRSKMTGLSRYGIKGFEFSSHLDDVPDYDNAALIADSAAKREGINRFIASIMAERGLRFSPTQSEDLELGGVDLIDTGSTGRGTNTEKTSDFDFIMRIDGRENQEELSKAICAKLGLDYEKEAEAGHILGNGNIRLKGVTIPGLSEPVDLDISYVRKDEIDFYSTDECLKDRLETIKRQDPDKYQRVLDNIIYAKKFLKEAGCYKPSHAPNSEGGLGGVGIENWILQNGGSFTDACTSFVAASTKENGRPATFEEFKERYKVYDFGRNFYGKGFDEFVSDNMTEEGYERMVEACKDYVKGASTRQRDKSTSLSDSLTTTKSVNL